jgi:hypothetical protein
MKENLNNITLLFNISEALWSVIMAVYVKESYKKFHTHIPSLINVFPQFNIEKRYSSSSNSMLLLKIDHSIKVVYQRGNGN